MQLKQVEAINNIVVSSDSIEYLNIASKMGVKTQLRPIEYCDEKTKSFGDVVEYVAANMDGDHVLWATCTSPLTNSDDYEKAIQTYFEELGTYDSLVSFTKIKQFVWDDNRPINYQTGEGHVSTSDVQNLYIKTCGISIAPRHDMIRWKYDHGANPFKFILDKRASVDVDDLYDLACARAWLDL
jgi:N-acylneuraminate cytidylyltransferase